MHVTESLRDDLRQHVDNVLTKLMSITLVLVAVTAFLDRNTNYNSSRDYLLMVCLSAGLVVLFNAWLTSVTASDCRPDARPLNDGEDATAWRPSPALSSGTPVALATSPSSMIRLSGWSAAELCAAESPAGVTPDRPGAGAAGGLLDGDRFDRSCRRAHTAGAARDR